MLKKKCHGLNNFSVVVNMYFCLTTESPNYDTAVYGNTFCFDHHRTIIRQ